MFFSEFVLTKKGPLAKIWLAAHWDRKLTKSQILETDIKDSVKIIENPVVPIALRTSGHLLLGVVKIYSRKIKYFLAECNEAMTKIKLQAIPETKVDLAEKQLQATFAQITLPDITPDVPLLLPDIDTGTFALDQPDIHLSRFEDITMEDYEQWYTAPQTEEAPTPDVLRKQEAPGMEDLTRLEIIGEEIPFTPIQSKEQPLFPPEEEEVLPPMEEVLPPIETPEERQRPEEEERIRKEEAERRRKLRKRKRKDVVIDEVIEIPSDVYKRQTRETRDILREKRLAPGTKEAMLQRPPTLDEIWTQPVVEGLPEELAQIFRDNMTEMEQERKRRKVEEEEIEIPFPPLVSPLPPVEEEVMRERIETVERLAEIPPAERPSAVSIVEEEELIPFEPVVEETISKEVEERNERLKREYVVLKEQYKALGVTDKTLKVLHVLGETFKKENTDTLVLNDILRGRSRETAAKCFFEVLVLKTKNILNVRQEEPYGDITISQAQNFVQ